MGIGFEMKAPVTSPALCKEVSMLFPQGVISNSFLNGRWSFLKILICHQAFDEFRLFLHRLWGRIPSHLQKKLTPVVLSNSCQHLLLLPHLLVWSNACFSECGHIRFFFFFLLTGSLWVQKSHLNCQRWKMCFQKQGCVCELLRCGLLRSLHCWRINPTVYVSH